MSEQFHIYTFIVAHAVIELNEINCQGIFLLLYPLFTNWCSWSLDEFVSMRLKDSSGFVTVIRAVHRYSSFHPFSSMVRLHFPILLK